MTESKLIIDGQEFTAETEDEESLLRLYMRAIQLSRQKRQDYGTATWKGLGAKGEFPYIYHKTLRLKQLLWEGNAANFESTEDNLIDLLNYVCYTLILIKEEHEASDRSAHTAPDKN